MPTIKARLLLTDAAVARLPFDPKGFTVADTRLAAFRCRVGKGVRAYHFEAERRENGKRKSVFRHLGDASVTKAADAYRQARILAGEVAAKVVAPGKREAMSLAVAARRYVGDLAMKPGKWWLEVERVYLTMMHKEFGDRSLISLSDNPDEIAEWFKRISKKNGPYAANRAAGMLRSIYRAATNTTAGRSLPARDPTSAIRFNPERTRDVMVEDLAAWAKEVRKVSPNRAVYHRLALLLGCRPGECARLKWKDIEPKARLIILRGTKMGNDVPVPMSAAIARELKKARSFSLPTSPYLFPSNSESGHLTIWNEPKFPELINGHALRHTYRTIGIAEPLIELLMGHARKGVSQKYIVRRQAAMDASMRAAQRKMSVKILKAMGEG